MQYFEVYICTCCFYTRTIKPINNSDEGRDSFQSLLAIKMKARTVVGTWEKSLLSDPGSELRLRSEGEGEGYVRR